MADELTPDTFRDALDTTFQVALDGGATELVLHRLTVHPSSGGPRAEPFTLTFLGPAGAHLAQHTYAVAHPDLGAFHIFLVPVGPLPDGRQQYEAVFN